MPTVRRFDNSYSVEIGYLPFLQGVLLNLGIEMKKKLVFILNCVPF